MANPLSQSNMAEDFGGITCVCSNTSPVMMLCNTTATAASEQMQCCRPPCGSRFPTAPGVPQFARFYTSSLFVANERQSAFQIVCRGYEHIERYPAIASLVFGPYRDGAQVLCRGVRSLRVPRVLTVCFAAIVFRLKKSPFISKSPERGD